MSKPEQMDSYWSFEYDDSFTPSPNRIRIVADCSREERRKSGSSARPEQIATVYNFEIAKYLVDIHNLALHNLKFGTKKSNVESRIDSIEKWIKDGRFI